jgi:hypothetical protein
MPAAAIPLRVLTAAELTASTVPELRQLCTEYAVDTLGVKRVLVTRLEALMRPVPGGAPPPPPPGGVPMAGGVVKMSLNLLVTQGFIEKTLETEAKKCLDEGAVCDVILAVVFLRMVKDRGAVEFDITTKATIPLTARRLCNTEIAAVPEIYTGAGQAAHTSPFLLCNGSNGSDLRSMSSKVLLGCRSEMGISGPLLAEPAASWLFEEAFGELLDYCVANSFPAVIVNSLFSAQATPEKAAKPAINPKKEMSLEAFVPLYKSQILLAGETKHLEKSQIANASGAKGMWTGLRATTLYVTEEHSYSVGVLIALSDPDGKKNEDYRGDGFLITAGSDGLGTVSTEASETFVKKETVAFNGEILSKSHGRGITMAQTRWVITFGIKEAGSGKERFGRKSLERYVALLTRCAGLGGMTAAKFRTILLQVEALIMSLVNDGSEAGGGKVETLGEAYDRASDSLENKIDNHIVNRADLAPVPRGGASGGGGVQKRGAAAPARGSQASTPPKKTKTAVRHHPRLPGGMGSHGGKPCAKETHDPSQGGHVRAWCSRSHVHWDSTLEPSAEDVKKAQDEADRKNKAP